MRCSQSRFEVKKTQSLPAGERAVVMLNRRAIGAGKRRVIVDAVVNRELLAQLPREVAGVRHEEPADQMVEAEMADCAAEHHPPRGVVDLLHQRQAAERRLRHRHHPQLFVDLLGQPERFAELLKEPRHVAPGRLRRPRAGRRDIEHARALGEARRDVVAAGPVLRAPVVAEVDDGVARQLANAH